LKLDNLKALVVDDKKHTRTNIQIAKKDVLIFIIIKLATSTQLSQKSLSSYCSAANCY